MTRRGTYAALFAVAAALVAGACSSSSKSSSVAGGSGGSTTSCSGPGISNGKLTVGVIDQTTGNPTVVGDFQYAIDTVNARFALQNSQGGVDGLQRAAVAADDGGTTTQDLAAARQLVEQNNVFGIVQISIEPGGSGDYLKSKGIPVTGWATAADPYALDNNYFGAVGGFPTDPAKTPDTSIVGFLKSKGVTNLALFGGTDPGSVAASAGTAAAARLDGMSVGYQTNSVAFGTKDFTADVAKMKSAHVDGVVTELDPVTNLALVGAIKQAGLTPTIMLTTGYDQRLINAVPTLIQGDYFLSPTAPFELGLPAIQTFEQTMAKDAPKVPIAEVSAITWISADLFIRGLQAAGHCPTRKNFIANLRKVTYDAGGMIAPVNEATQVGRGNPCYWEVQAEGKKFVPQSPQPFCGKPLK
jgi:branched-chain amino acid transport system substrate-binding protein